MLEWPVVFFDLLLVENQFPFLVILELWDKTIANLGGGQRNITSLLQQTPFWKEGLSSPTVVVDERETLHLLDLYYKWNVPIQKRASQLRSPWLFCIFGSAGELDEKATIPSATELYEAGVKFKPKEMSLNTFDLSSPSVLCYQGNCF